MAFVTVQSDAAHNDQREVRESSQQFPHFMLTIAACGASPQRKESWGSLDDYSKKTPPPLYTECCPAL